MIARRVYLAYGVGRGLPAVSTNVKGSSFVVHSGGNVRFGGEGGADLSVLMRS
jgi:hypothetical protein